MQITQSAATDQNTDTNTVANTKDAYGSAVKVDLSAQAQAVVIMQETSADQTATNSVSSTTASATEVSTSLESVSGSNAADINSSSNNGSVSSSDSYKSSSHNWSVSSINSSGSSTKQTTSGGGGGVSVDDTSSDVTKAKRKVAAQVGIVAANQLVDKKGNINRIGLAEELAKQQQIII
jgi:hypothetical protein